jgi:hypothetical protein
VSVYPSLGINSFFVGGNQTEFPALEANAAFGAGTVVTRMSELRHPDLLMAFISARSGTRGNNAQGYYQVTPPYLVSRRWAPQFNASLDPNEWGFVAPRFGSRAAAALLDGHVEIFDLRDMQDMRRWCNRADQPDFVLKPR